MNNEIKKVYNITFSNEKIMKRFERLLAFLNFVSGSGASRGIGMYIDADGNEKIFIDEVKRKHAHEIDCICHSSGDIVIASEAEYRSKKFNNDYKSAYTREAANLFREGKLIQTIPTQDYDYKEI